MNKYLEMLRDVLKETAERFAGDEEPKEDVFHAPQEEYLSFTGPSGEVVTGYDKVGADFVQGYARVVERSQEIEDQWIAMLREHNVSGAHPDDGHVDRIRNIVTLMYPQFDDRCGCHDLFALGWPERYRIVRLVEWVENKYAVLFEVELKEFRFEEVPPEEISLPWRTSS